MKSNSHRLFCRFLWIAAIPVFLLNGGCDHDTDPFDGPSLVDRFGPFVVEDSLAASRTNVDFSAGENVFFTAQLNKNIDWTIVITGLESGAVRRIEGFDRFINANVATWTGGTTVLPFFRNEMCTAVLVVPEENYASDTLSIEVIGTKIYEGNLVTGFEENVVGNCIQVNDFEFELTQSGRVNDELAGQEEYFFRLRGTDNASGGPTDNFFVGLGTIRPCVNQQTYFEVPTTVPQNLYINFLLLGEGSPYTRCVIAVFTDSNNNGVFDDGQDGGVEFEVDAGFTGWRLQSFSFADIGATSEVLEKLVAIRVILISLNNIQPSPREQVSFGTDFITFTAGGPLKL